MDEDILIQLDDVGVRYRVLNEPIPSFKEYIIRWVQKRVKFREFWALQGVNLQIRRGEVFGIVGPNGAGKSTLLKLVARVFHPTRGRVRVRGKVAPLLELGAGFDMELTGRENVFLNGAILGYPEADIRERFDRIVDFAELWEFIDAPLRTYSTGMVARLGFSIATDVRPEILIVDEILGVGDSDFQTRSFERIERFKGEGTTILLVTHSLAKVEEVCTRAAWLDKGQVQAVGSAGYVVNQYISRAQDREARRLREETKEEKTHWGTGKVIIESAQLLGEAGEEKTMYYPGDMLKLEIRYRAKEPIAEPVVGLAFFRQDGLHISGPNTEFANSPLPPLVDRGRIIYEIPCLPLLEGKYEITIALHDKQSTEFYDVIERSFPFRIVKGGETIQEQYGLMALGGRFYHETG